MLVPLARLPLFAAAAALTHSSLRLGEHNFERLSSPQRAPILWVDTTKSVDTSGPVPQLNVTTWLNQPDSAPPVRFGDGHVYVLGFTAWWCQGCPATYIPLAHIAKRYVSQGVRVILLTNLYEKDPEYIKRYFNAHNVKLPVAIEKGDKSAFDVKILPHVLMIDPKGVIRAHWGPDLPNRSDYEVMVAATLDSVLKPLPAAAAPSK